MSRTTTLLALLQTMLVVVGFFALAVVLKMDGYPESAGLRWNPLAVFLREHGFWLLNLPLLWVVLSRFAEHRDRGCLSYRAVSSIGICIATAIIAVFLYASMHPFTHPILIRVR